MILKFIPAIIWAFIIAVLCLLPQSAFYNPEFLHKLPLDKIAHFTMFFILSILVWLGMKITNYKAVKIPKYSILLVILILLLYGGITELAQNILTKTRHTEFLDFLADCAGILAGLFFYLLIKRRKISNQKEFVKY